jgi:hypothetical protein
MGSMLVVISGLGLCAVGGTIFIRGNQIYDLAMTYNIQSLIDSTNNRADRYFGGGILLLLVGILLGVSPFIGVIWSAYIGAFLALSEAHKYWGSVLYHVSAVMSLTIAFIFGAAGLGLIIGGFIVAINH